MSHSTDPSLWSRIQFCDCPLNQRAFIKLLTKQLAYICLLFSILYYITTYRTNRNISLSNGLQVQASYAAETAEPMKECYLQLSLKSFRCFIFLIQTKKQFSSCSSYCLELPATHAYVILHISMGSRQTNLLVFSYVTTWFTRPSRIQDSSTLRVASIMLAISKSYQYHIILHHSLINAIAITLYIIHNQQNQY